MGHGSESRKAQALRALYGISRAAAQQLETGHLADTTATVLRQLFEVDVVTLWLWDGTHSEMKALVRSYPSGVPAPSITVLGPSEGLAGASFSSGRVIVAEDYAASGQAYAGARAAGVKSAVGAPLAANGRLVGSLVLGCFAPRRFTAGELDILAYVADQIGPLAEAVSLRSDAKRSHQEALALADLARRCQESHDLALLLTVLAGHTVQLLEADYAVVGMAEAGEIRLLGSSGVRDEALWATPRPVADCGVSRTVLEAGRTLVLREADLANVGGSIVPHMHEGGHTVLATPLRAHAAPAGALHAGWRHPHEATREEVRVLETLATVGGGMVAAVRDHQRATELAARLQAIIDQMPSGVCVVDAAGKLSVLNRAGCGIAGLPPDSPVLGGVALEDMRALFQQHDFDFERSALGQALGGQRVQREYRVHTMDGRDAWLSASASPLLDGAGKPAGAITVFSDVTEARLAGERHERETERRLALAAISEALGGAGHDLDAMLEITCRETGRALTATCAIRLLEGSELVLHGGVYDPNPALAERVQALMSEHSTPEKGSSHRRALDSGQALRWFDPTGRERASRSVVTEVRTLVTEQPLYAMLVVPLRAKGGRPGTLGLYRRHAEPFTDEDEAFAVDIGARAGLVIENAQLFGQLAASRARLAELSQRIVQLAERERRGIALELHDEIGQGLTAARLLLQAARRLPTRLRDERLDEACRTLDEAVDQVRGLSLDLRPPLLDRFGLAAALEGYLERYADRTGVQAVCRAEGLCARPAPQVDMAAYRIIQEALTNVARHSGADQAEVELWSDERDLWIKVSDEGRGFDPALLEWEPSTGLTGMQERAELLGGRLTIDAAPGRGVRLLACLPLAADP